MHSVRCRVVLPIVMLALSAALLFVGRAYEAADKAISAAREPPTQIDPKTGELVAGFQPLSCWDCFEPLSILAMSINAPAVVVVGAPLLLSGHEDIPRVIGRALVVLAVVIMWYWVGWGIDRRRGIFPRANRTGPRWLRILLCCCGLSGCAAFILGLFHTVMGWLLMWPAIIWVVGLAVYWSKGLYRTLFRNPSTVPMNDGAS
jgi:hypothetical protein